LLRAGALWDRPGPRKAFVDDRNAILEGLVKKFPNDIQAFRRYLIDSEIGKSALIERYKARRDASPSDPLAIYFYAQTLVGRDTPQAIRLFERSLEEDPELAWAHNALANIYSYGKFQDKAKTRKHIDTFFSICPSVFDAGPLRTLGSDGSPETQRLVAKALQERLAAETNTDRLNVYRALWDLEFRIAPPNEHSELRKQIAADVKHIRELVSKPTLDQLRTLREGLKQANDAAGAIAVDDEILRAAPASSEAARITLDRWNKEHPNPKSEESEEKKREHAALQYSVSGRWIEQWPWDPGVRAVRFQSAKMLKDLPAAEMKKAADQLVDFLRENAVMWANPPFPQQAAEEFLKRGIYFDEVVALAEAGVEEVRKRESEREKSDRDPAEFAKFGERALRSAELTAIEQLAQASMKLNRRGEAAALQSRLNKITPDDAQEKAAKMRVASRVTELSGRKADAFAYLEKSIELTPGATNDFLKEREKELRADARRLWNELGGSEETWKLRSEVKAQVQEAKADTGWKAPEKVVPSFDLADLDGKRWKTDQFAGKTVLINVWASWCGPCVAEHPHLQKLYERVKDREDIAIVTLNVDDQIGLVQPYIEKNKYTFPVLFADKYIHSLFDGFSIPRNWVLDSKGTHRFEQIGFGEASDWERRTLDMIERLKGGQVR